MYEFLAGFVAGGCVVYFWARIAAYLKTKTSEAIENVDLDPFK